MWISNGLMSNGYVLMALQAMLIDGLMSVILYMTYPA
jgi:hypothetical protein